MTLTKQPAEAKVDEMNPPAYAPPPAAATAPRRSIHDLRTQIIANGTILKPRLNTERPSDDHIELVVAKAPAGYTPVKPPTANQRLSKQREQMQAAAMSEKHALMERYEAMNLGSSSSSSSGKHYAVLIRRSYTKKEVRVIIQGEPQDTVEEALEWMLERTEHEIHEMVTKFGKQEEDVDCCVM